MTLPSILPTVAIMLIMAVGGMLNSNTDLILLLYTSATYETSDVLGTYIYRQGIRQSHLGYAAALSVVLLVLAVIGALLTRRASKGE